MIWQILYIVFALLATAWAVHSARSRKWVFFIMGVSVLYLGFINQGCLCSVGSIQNLIDAIIGDIHTVTLGTLLLFGIPILAALIWGRIFCGGVCPLGGIQDLFNIKRVVIPRWIDTILKMVPVIVLGGIVLAIIRDDGYLLCKYDFIVPIFRFNASGIILTLLLTAIGISLFISRPFCRYLCPYGKLLGWVSIFARRKVTVSPSACSKCSFCGDVCPVNAITYPENRVGTESKRSRLLWIILAVVAIPLWALSFRQVGSQIAVPAKTAKTIIVLTEKEKLSKRQEVKLQEAIETAQEHAVMGEHVGVGFGIMWGIVFLAVVCRKPSDLYKVDSAECIECGRCYNHCPKGVVKGATANRFDHIMGHIRHRKKTPDSKGHRRISFVVPFLTTIIVILSTVLLVNNVKMANANPIKQPELRKLQVAIKMDSDNQEMQNEFRELRDRIEVTYRTATQVHEMLMKLLFILLVLMVLLLKYRHNRYLLPLEKVAVNKSVRPLITIIVERIGVILLGVLVLIIVHKIFPPLPL